MDENGSIHILKRKKLFWISIWLMFVYWNLESVIHVYVFNEGTFWEQFLNPSPHEIWMRSIVILVLFVLGLYADFMVNIHRKAEERIRLAHAELNQIFNTAADGMHVVDESFNVLRVNDTFSKMVGVSEEEAVNKKCYEVFEGSLCHTPSCPLRRIMNGEKYVEFDSVKKRRDGSLISCIVTAKPFKDSNGNLLGIIEHFRDITDRKIGENKLRESEERWKALYKHIPVPVYIWEKNENSFILTGYNDAAFSITNGKVKECLGKSADEFYRNRPDIIEDFRVCYDEKKIIRKEMDYYYATQDKVMHFIVGYAFAPLTWFLFTLRT